jgi:1-deoxy-D-xylulose-5-phosphate synthase
MMKTAFCSHSPIAFRYPRGAGYGVHLDSHLKRLDIGKAEILREGDDLVIAALGSTVIPSLEAAGELEERGIHAAVVNARFVKPLDGELLCDLAQKTARVLTVEENVCEGGFGSAILELCQSRGLSSVEVRCLGIPDVFVEHGSQAKLREKYGVDSHGISLSVLGWIGEERIGKRPPFISQARSSH